MPKTLDYSKLNIDEKSILKQCHQTGGIKVRRGSKNFTRCVKLSDKGWLWGTTLGETVTFMMSREAETAYEAATAQPTPPPAPAETPAAKTEFVWTGQSSLRVGDWVHIQLTGARHNGFIGEIVVYDDPYYQVLFNDGEYGSFLAINLIPVEKKPAPAGDECDHLRADILRLESDYAALEQERDELRAQVAGLVSALDAIEDTAIESRGEWGSIQEPYSPEWSHGYLWIIEKCREALDAATAVRS